MLRFLAVPALVGLFWVSAPGQSYRNFRDELNEITTQARWRLGPLRFLPKLQIQNFGYDDNVYFRSPAEGPVGDYTGTLSPEVKTYLLVGHSIILSFDENPEYIYFAKEARLRTFANSFSPGLRLSLFNRFALSGEYHFLKHTRRAFDEFLTLVTDTSKGTSASFFYETPRGSSIGLSMLIDRFAYEDLALPGYEAVFSRALNRKETTGNIEFYYPVFSESAFFIKVGATRYDFEHPSSRWKDSRSVQTLTGLRFPFMGRARGTIALGYKRFVPEAKDQKIFSGLIANTDLDFRFGRFGFRVGLGRDNYFSYLEDAHYFVENRESAGISYRLTRRLRLGYDVRFAGLRYPDPFMIEDPVLGPREILRKDTQRTHSIGVAVFFFRKTGIQLSYNFFKRNSNMPGLDRNKGFIGISLTQDF